MSSLVNKIRTNRYEKKDGSLKKLFKYIAPFKVKIFIGIIFGIIGTLCTIAAPLMLREVSTTILNGIEGNPDYYLTILKFCGIAFGLYAAAFLFNFTQVYIMIGVTSATSKKLRRQMSEKINTLPLRYFDNTNIGNVLSYVTNDVDTVGTTLNQSLSSIISSVVTLVGVTIILFVLSWQIALVAVIALPIAFLVLILIGKHSQKHFISRQDLISEVSSKAEEAYTAYNIIRVFRANQDFKDSFAEYNFKLEKSCAKADFFAGLMNPLMNFIGNLMFSGICLVGGILVGSSQDAALIATIVAAVTYGDQLIQPLSQLAQLFANFQSTIASAGRVFSFLEEVDQENEGSKVDTISKVEGNIEFSHVRFGYNKDRVIIHDFSEKAKSGQKVAIVGPTGAGKTTMVNLLMRFYDIDQGEIKIEGKDTMHLNRSYVRSLFGMVLQDTWLFQGTFMENLKYSRRDATDEEVIEACKATHCDTFIRQQPGGYNCLLTEESGLSSGQKQLITIARAMVQNAPMLILDEATSSVDTRTELLIQDAMDKLMVGRTSFVIAHRLSTIKNSDLILVMKDGDVIESGNHEQLMAKKGFYADLYNAQFSGKGPMLD